jgi:predicted NUDIX family NTP pyrophosphohydrolase
VATKRSAGILLYRRIGEASGSSSPGATTDRIEVLLAHPGGPFWSRRDAGAWSIPKGEYLDDELAEVAAKREFVEELGLPVPDGDLIPLGEARQKSGKLVTAWALEADLDPEVIVPGMFSMEWPKNSGAFQEIPEIDRVQWFTIGEARERITAGQQAFLDRLVELLED